MLRRRHSSIMYLWLILAAGAIADSSDRRPVAVLRSSTRRIRDEVIMYRRGICDASATISVSLVTSSRPPYLARIGVNAAGVAAVATPNI